MISLIINVNLAMLKLLIAQLVLKLHQLISPVLHVQAVFIYKTETVQLVIHPA